MKKTNIVAGACFGYFDQNFPDCRKCGIASGCRSATGSERVQEIRSIAKLTHAQVDQLAGAWLSEEIRKKQHEDQ